MRLRKRQPVESVEPLCVVRGVPLLLSRVPAEWLVLRIRALHRELEEPKVFESGADAVRLELKALETEARRRGLTHNKKEK